MKPGCSVFYQDPHSSCSRWIRASHPKGSEARVLPSRASSKNQSLGERLGDDDRVILFSPKEHRSEGKKMFRALISIVFLFVATNSYAEFLTVNAPIEWNGYVNNGWSDDQEAECLEHPAYGGIIVYCEHANVGMCGYFWRGWCSEGVTGINARTNCPIGYFHVDWGICRSICDSALHYNEETEECDECHNDSDCDDNLICNGLETCVVGNCQDGAALDCNDEIGCTEDVCEEPNGCVHNIGDQSQCICDIPAPVTISKSISKQLESPDVTCPVIGGSSKYSATIDGQVSLEEGNCANNCTSNAAGAVSLTGVFGVCGGTVAVKGTASHSLQQSGCLECEPASCEKYCRDGTCDTETTGGALSLTYSQFYGTELDVGTSEYGLSTKCGTTLGIGGSLEKSASSTSNSGSTCNSCDDCEKKTLSGSIGAGALGDCFLEIRVGNTKNQVGCVGCGALDLKGTVSNEVEVGSGACGGLDCTSMRVDGKAVITTPRFTSNTAWWTVDIKCQASVVGCTEYNNCNTPSCKDDVNDTDGISLKKQVSCSVGL